MAHHSLMLITAHPDDEAFLTPGIIQRAIAAGGRAAVVCATRGDAGEIAAPSLATPETLGAVREEELRTACALMGVTDLTILGYPDGQVAETPDDEIVGRVVREVRRFRPQVLITFEANGGYGHPDHMAVHRATMRAFERAANPHQYPEQIAEGLAPFQPERVLGFALPRSLMRDMRRSAEEETDESFQPGGDAATIPFEEMGTPDEAVAYSVPLEAEEVNRKVQVLRAHRTQMAPDNPASDPDSPFMRRWLGTETFSQLAPAWPHGEPVQSDVFAGIDPE